MRPNLNKPTNNIDDILDGSYLEALTAEVMRLLGPLVSNYSYGIADENGRYIQAVSRLTPEIIRESVAGTITIDLRVADASSLLVFDIDVKSEYFKDGKLTSIQQVNLKKTIKDILERLRMLDVSFFAEYSGRRGAHIWVFCKNALSTKDLKYLAKWVINDLPLPKEVSIEVKPSKQSGGIRLLHTKHPITNIRSMFMSPDLQPYYGSSLDFLKEVRLNDADKVMDIISSIKEAEKLATETSSKISPEGDLSELRRCKVIDRCFTQIDESKVLPHKERLVIGLLVSSLKNSKITEQTVDLFRAADNFDEQTTQKMLTVLCRDRAIGCKKIGEMLGLCEGNCSEIAGYRYHSPVSFLTEKAESDPILFPEGVITPKGYLVTKRGVLLSRPDGKGGFDYVEVTPVLLYVSARTTHLRTEQVGVELSFSATGREKMLLLTVPMRVISDATLILELADRGIGITSNNRVNIIEYLHKQYHQSSSTLRHKQIYDICGWMDYRCRRIFALPDRVFGVEGVSDVAFEFVPSDQAGRLAAGLKTNGSFDDWKDACTRLVTKYRYFTLVLAVAFAAPLLAIFDVANFIIHICGESSKGKTTLQMLAASVWGYPGDSTHAFSQIAQWRTTDNGLEALAGRRNNLPLLLDESHQADRRTIEKSIYLLANGAGKARSKIDGEGRAIRTWSNITISTGENSLLSNRTTTGQEVRTLEYSKSPFCEDDEDHREEVDALRASLLNHYGHAGAMFMERIVALVNDETDLAALKSDFRDKHNDLIGRANSAFHARNAQLFAVLWSALDKANLIFGIFENPDDIRGKVYQLYLEAGEKWASDITTAEKALRYVWDQIGAQKERIGTKHPDILGTTCNTQGYMNAVAFYETKLDELLDKGGFDPKSIKKAFRERGYLVVDKEGELVQVKRDGKKMRSYVFHRDLAPHLYFDLTDEEAAEGAEDSNELQAL